MAEASEFLKMFSGRTQTVLTAVAFWTPGRRPAVRVVTTERLRPHEFRLPAGMFITPGHVWASITVPGIVRDALHDAMELAVANVPAIEGDTLDGIDMAAGGGLHRGRQRRWPRGRLTYESNKDPIVWLLALAGISYVPMALVAGATDLGFGHILNPMHIFGFIRRMGRRPCSSWRAKPLRL
jgi:hypothetical protein